MTNNLRSSTTGLAKRSLIESNSNIICLNQSSYAIMEFKKTTGSDATEIDVCHSGNFLFTLFERIGFGGTDPFMKGQPLGLDMEDFFSTLSLLGQFLSISARSSGFGTSLFNMLILSSSNYYFQSCVIIILNDKQVLRYITTLWVTAECIRYVNLLLRVEKNENELQYVPLIHQLQAKIVYLSSLDNNKNYSLFKKVILKKLDIRQNINPKNNQIGYQKLAVLGHISGFN
ncbi:hypothetical protein BpHYR1_045917 [Brachionus plicatilis]|uniref:Uncharacterized protein n=1 Tax=Brachionus plicatilis TaxID=10195 RepID=A0A3M7PIR6_BRAPC|nr:hypothetical protein BpHYR1_045917 [Brachionus plicatilis]